MGAIPVPYAVLLSTRPVFVTIICIFNSPIDRAERSCYTTVVIFRSFAQILIAAFLVACCAEANASIWSKIFSDDFDVDVGDRRYPSDFDPYFNQLKIYHQPRYYEYTSKKRKGDKVFKTTKVKNEYGQTVYKKTTKVKKKNK
jgi:hypothetical protein